MPYRLIENQAWPGDPANWVAFQPIVLFQALQLIGSCAPFVASKRGAAVRR
jgi:hypothetical protein